MKVREEFARETARQLLAEMGDNPFPIQMEEVCRAKGWIVGRSRKIHSDCDAVTMHIDGEYGIYLHAGIKSESRIRWTLCHEAGHILLGHFEEFDLTFGHSEALGKGTAWVLNRETNIFTEELLMPAAFIQKNLCLGFEALRAACGVSRAALAIRLKNLTLAPTHYPAAEQGYGLGQVAEGRQSLGQSVIY
jgi:Zn-dependent peptidase ImmA (M78 family)